MKRVYGRGHQGGKSSRPAMALEAMESRQLCSVGPVGLEQVMAQLPHRIGDGPSNSPLSVEFGSNGIAKLSYNGTTLFDATKNPYEGFRISNWDLITSDGRDISQNMWNTACGTSWDAGSDTLSYIYAWGNVTTQYTVTADRVTMSIHVVNTTSDETLGGLTIFPMSVRFPQMPKDFGPWPVVAFGKRGPSVSEADFGTGTMAVVNEDNTRSLYTGYFSNNHSVASNLFDLWIGSQPIGYQPTGWPKLTRSVAPGTTDSYSVSLRFGASGSTASVLAKDVYTDYTQNNPFELNWPDRRPIARLFPSGSSDQSRAGTNPRGWFNDPNVDVTMPQGLANFRDRLLAYADQSVNICKSMNSQGVIVWDIEGEGFSMYMGDPRLTDLLAPEMTFQNAADQFFQKFRDAGLRVGVTLNAWQYNVDTGTFARSDDYSQQLIDKIHYAEQRWGCTMFYIDSTDWNDDPGILENVHKACPDVLLVPENQSVGNYAVSAPYDELRMGVSTTPSALRKLYPGAFSVISVEGGDIEGNRTALTRAVRNGDILTFAGWYNDPANAIVKSIYDTVAQLNGGGNVTPGPFSNTAVSTDLVFTMPLEPGVVPLANGPFAIGINSDLLAA